MITYNKKFLELKAEELYFDLDSTFNELVRKKFNFLLVSKLISGVRSIMACAIANRDCAITSIRSHLLYDFRLFHYDLLRMGTEKIDPVFLEANRLFKNTPWFFEDRPAYRLDVQEIKQENRNDLNSYYYLIEDPQKTKDLIDKCFERK